MKKSFVHLAEAWYKGAVLEHRTDGYIDDVYLEIEIAEDTPFHKCSNMYISWHVSADKKGIMSRINAYDDTYWMFPYISDVLLYLSNNQDVTPEQFCEFLKTVGYVDETKMEY